MKIMYFLASIFLISATLAHSNPVIYKADSSIAKKKHLVLIASDHEYRAEETIPALARILTKHHGFDCTVLFGIDDNGEIEAGISNIPGLEALKTADGMVMFTRFLALPADQMVHIDDYLNRAGPVVALRTSTHAFNITDTEDPYYKYHFRYEGDDYKAGFGHQVLGQSWVGHYGRNHTQSTRITIVPDQAEHKILTGVKNIHVQCGGYNAEPAPDWTILTMAQPLMTMEADGEPDKTKPAMASEWTREYTGKDGKKGRVMTSLYGASEDILNPGYRRMIINGVYWSLGLEDQIKADSNIEFVGAYKPNTFRNAGHARGIKPSAYNGFKSPIPANNNVSAPAEKQNKEKKEEKKEKESDAKPAKAKSAKVPAPSIMKSGDARFVRIQLEGASKTLSLAEVEVYSGGKNIAKYGTAKQSSIASDGEPKRAIDGNKNPAYGEGGQTHTSKEKNPWWELDLGESASIDKIEIYNRGDNLSGRLNNFSLVLLDAKRQTLYEQKGLAAPAERMSIDLKNKGKVSYLTAQGKAGVIAAKLVPPTKKSEPALPPEPVIEMVSVPSDYKDTMPFAFKQGDSVAIVGNGLADHMQHHGWTETLLQKGAAEHQITFRNLSISGDMVDKFPRNKGFSSQEWYLKHVEADVIFFFFGYNESFQGVEKAGDYKAKLGKLIQKYRGVQPNGKSFPRIVLFSPIAHENLEDVNLPTGDENNERLAAYAAATKEVAAEKGVTYVDLFDASQALYAKNPPLTINGVHLNEEGYRLIGEVIAEALIGEKVTADQSLAPLRESVLDKNWNWHNRYRATDGNDVWGTRSTLKFVDDQSNAEVLKHELIMLDVLTANRDHQIWARANGKDHKIDDSNVPPAIKVISNIGGGSHSSSAEKEGSIVYNSGQDAIEKFIVPEGYKVNLFADEKAFPDLANPVQLQVDGKGRIWAASWNTYPKWEPLKEMNDSLMIFEDHDEDGVADKSKIFAEVHNPLGFEFWNGGVLVTSMPDLWFLKDIDGDDKADIKKIMLQGIGSSDTHHAANNLIYGPDGGIYWQSGIFLVHNHEHPWGAPLQMGNSGMYRFDPRRHTIAFHAGNSPNPHGIAFDYWGYHYANDGTGGRSFQVRPKGSGFKMHQLLVKEVRPVAADEIISSDNWPEDIQNDFLICNTIGFLGLKHYKLHRDGFEEKNMKKGEVWGTPHQDLLFSQDKNFRPTDAIFGEDGALYISDWQNVIIGHMQHNVRDPNRDHVHGRIYRMVHTGRPLQAKVKIDGASIPELLKNLEHPVNGVRHRTRVELSEHDAKEVIAETEKWMAQFDSQKAEDAHHLLEALWVHQQFNVRNLKLLGEVLQSPEDHARIAALTVQHHWTAADPALGAQVIAKEDHGEKATKSGILSDGPEFTEIRIGTIQEKMQYDVTSLQVKAGKKIKLTFANPDFMPHNIVFVQPKASTEVANAALILGADGFKKEWVPESDKVVFASKLIDHKQEETYEFNAPKKPGDYEYICTFPGHVIMKGILKVRK